ncbi:unnamed protein product [Ixodes pacificus]
MPGGSSGVAPTRRRRLRMFPCSSGRLMGSRMARTTASASLREPCPRRC